MIKNKIVLLFLLLIIYAIISLLFSVYVLNEKFYFNSFIDKLENEQIERMIAVNRKYAWVSLILNPIFYVFKLTFISISIYFIKLIIGEDFKATFSQIFFSVAVADVVFLVLAITKLSYFLLYPPTNLEVIQNFAPGSLYQLVSQVNEPWLVYPLQSISIWELGFIVVLASQLKEFFQNDFALSLQNILLSYGTVFLLWIVFMVFITLNLS